MKRIRVLMMVPLLTVVLAGSSVHGDVKTLINWQGPIPLPSLPIPPLPNTIPPLPPGPGENETPDVVHMPPLRPAWDGTLTFNETIYLMTYPDVPTIENLTPKEDAWEEKFDLMKNGTPPPISPLPPLPIPASASILSSSSSSCQPYGGACATLIIPGYAGVSSAGNGNLSRFDDMVDFLEDSQTETVTSPACCTNTIDGMGPVYIVDLYGGACGSDFIITSYGYHGNWLPSGHESQAHCSGSSTNVREHSKNKFIEHLAYHLAWMIYEEFPDTKVDIVAHSMGGLVARYMIDQMQRENPEFPPSLDVEDVVTMGTPHGGIYKACFDSAWQGYQMCGDSGFMRYLAANAQSPSTSSGEPTFWTVLASACDGVVSKGSAWDMDARWKHAVDGESDTNDCPGHSDYYQELYHSSILHKVPQWWSQVDGTGVRYQAYDYYAVGLGTRIKYSMSGS